MYLYVRALKASIDSELLPPPFPEGFSCLHTRPALAQPGCVPGIQVLGELGEASKLRSSFLLGCMISFRNVSFRNRTLLTCPSGLTSDLPHPYGPVWGLLEHTACGYPHEPCSDRFAWVLWGCVLSGSPACQSRSPPGSPCSVDLPCSGCALILSPESPGVTVLSLLGFLIGEVCEPSSR